MRSSLTPFEHQMMCTVCNDLKHFKVKLNDAKRILANIERILPSTSVDTRDIKCRNLRNLFEEKKHAHFMCGHCMKADRQELSMVEDKITEAVIEFVACAIKNADEDYNHYERMYYDILRNLRGNYPKMAHNLEQYWFSSVKKTEDK